MELSQIEKDEIVETYAIELERMFDVVANHYRNDQHADHSLLLPAIEARIRTSLATVVE